MIQHSQEAQVTTDLGEEAPMHHNAPHEDIGNTDIEFACNVTRLSRRRLDWPDHSPPRQGHLQQSSGNSFAHADGRQRCANSDGLSEIGKTDLCTYREMCRGIHAWDRNQPHFLSSADHEVGQAEQVREEHAQPTRKKQSAS